MTNQDGAHRAVKKLDEYIKHADECRDMARTAQPSHRAQLEDMARTWDKLAEARRRQLEKDGKTEEYDTEGTGDRSQAS